MISITSELKLWTSADGSSHFMTVPEEAWGEIKLRSMASPRGFGSVKVEVTIGEMTWRTSLFPVKRGGYFLPVKIDVVRKTGIAAGDVVSAHLELL